MIKCIIFDFDGVIAESVDIKTEAFRELFKKYPKHLKTITQYHIKNGGISRYEKFRYIYRKILKEELSESKFRNLCNRFSKLVVNKVVHSPFVKGTNKLLEKCRRKYKLYIISGTPDFEIKKIVKQRGIKKFFDGVYGSPTKKIHLIKRILKKNNLHPKEVVFIGDSINDFRAAEKSKVKFICREKNKNLSFLKQKRVKIFKDLNGIYVYIKKLNSKIN